MASGEWIGFRTVKSMLVVKVDRCLGCKSCELACALEHSASQDLYQAIHEACPPKTRVRVGQGTVFAVPLQCRQCEDAPCMDICPTGALHRADADSPVLIDHDLCIGCMLCVLACPFGVITLDERGRTLVKCDQCFERVQEGQMPACVTACPTKALEYKSMEEVVADKRKASLVRIESALTGGGA